MPEAEQGTEKAKVVEWDYERADKLRVEFKVESWLRFGEGYPASKIEASCGMVAFYDKDVGRWTVGDASSQDLGCVVTDTLGLGVLRWLEVKLGYRAPDLQAPERFLRERR